jgi:hypothetical protein
MANGEALDPETAVGQVRLVVGDDVAASSGDYTFSDDAITVALSLSSDGITRAVSILVKQLALSASLSGQSIKADDFSINTTNRGKSLLEVALSYEAQADTEDIAANAGELTIVKTSLTPRLPARLPFGR